MEATPPTEGEGTTSTKSKGKGTRKKVTPPEENEERKLSHSFQLSMSCSAEMRKLEILKSTKDDENNDAVEVRCLLEFIGEDSLEGLPYQSAYKELLACSQETAEGKDTSVLKVKRNFLSCKVWLNDPLYKARTALNDAVVKRVPEATIVKGSPKVKIGFEGTVYAKDLQVLARMVKRTIEAAIEPAQQELL